MAVVQQAQYNLCIESYDRIEQALNDCVMANMLPANLLSRRAAILTRSYISGLMENWLFAPASFDLRAEAQSYVAILLEMYQFCPTLRGESAV
jgi:TetR/AcrR family acrAB operon transcriptional repressor